jgi:putative ABC transport system permease protein
MDAEVGPIWRSVRRHRVFALLVIEVALGFFIIGSLIVTIRWYRAKTRPRPGHLEEDVVEVVSRRPAAPPEAAAATRARERAALAALPDARGVAAVSASQIDDRFSIPSLFWSPDGAGASSGCDGVARSREGAVVGWDVAADPELAAVVALRFVEGAPSRPGASAGSTAPGTALVTRCLAHALFGDAPAVGRVLLSNRRAPARIAGVIEDVRMHVPFLFQTHVTAIYPAADDDARVARWFVRAAPGRGAALRAAVEPALAPGPDARVTARLFTEADTSAGHIASGTAFVLCVVGGSLGLLAVLGNLAVAAFLVSERRRIIGVRRALGATRWDIFRYLLIENLIPTQLGNLLGLLVLLANLPIVKARFAGIELRASDMVLTGALLTFGGVVAKLFPALRATRIPPSVVTRSL